MNRKMYMRLACQNIRKNKSIFLPFLLSCIMMTAMYYMLHSIWIQTDEAMFTGATTMWKVLQLGVFVAGVFSVCVLFYTNKFLMKQRAREFGLYSLLGMEKRHIAKVVFWEMALIGGIGIMAGLLLGILLSRLMFLVLLAILKLQTVFLFRIMPESIRATAVLFVLLFAAIILANNIRVFALRPIELMQSAHVGEREPKAKWILALLGLASLSYGYYLAVTAENPLKAMMTLFTAVMCVIAGTYLLFFSGSIAFLKLLKRSKRFYYHRKHFVTVSGMMYRMKQNALGLANICILCTGVLVVLSSTVSLYAGIEDILKNHYPKDVMTQYLYEKHIEDEGYPKHYDYALVQERLLQRAKEYDVTVHDIMHYYDYTETGFMEGNQFTVAEDFGIFDLGDEFCDLQIITAEDYSQLVGETVSLDAGTALAGSSGNLSLGDEIIIMNENWRIVGEPDLRWLEDNVVFNSNAAYGAILMVVPSLDDMLDISKAYCDSAEDGRTNAPVYHLYYDLEGSTQNKNAYCEGLRNFINDTEIAHLATVDNIYTTRPEIFGIYGGLFFVGIFVGVLFLITTVMIIYYKQISEGYDDRERFLIMQKVGMSRNETKGVIRSQIVQVFLLPIAAAIVHICFAFNIIKDAMVLLHFANTRLFIVCTMGTVLIFTLVYFAVYMLTARTYYKITSQS